MGKPSRLRDKHLEEDQVNLGTRFTYPDGSRKLYDRDKAPDGIDEDVWDLTLYFEQQAERYGESTPGRPIVYTELYHRLHTSGMRSNHTDWIPLVKMMITMYWDYEKDTTYSINDFCNVDKFTYYYQWVVDTLARRALVTTGNRVVQEDRNTKPSKSSEEDAEVRGIIMSDETEDEIAEKMRRFKVEHR